MLKSMSLVLVLLVTSAAPALAKEPTAAVLKATQERDAAKRALLEAQVAVARARAKLAEAAARLAEAKASAGLENGGAE